MRVLTTEEMRAAEAAAVERGTDYETLMENAGRAAAEEIIKLEQGRPSSILLLCGKGNNGGDALVIARLLAERGWTVSVSFLCGSRLSDLSQINLLRLSKTVRIIPPDLLQPEIAEHNYLADGVFGIGFRGDLPEHIRMIFETANTALSKRIALDLPSGMNADTGEVSPGTFKADQTYTFGAYKPALLLEETFPWRGDVTCLDIGL